MKYNEAQREKLQAVAAAAYRKSREEGRSQWWAAQDAWQAVKKADGRLRAPWWDEALADKTAAVRSYRSPLGEVVDVADVVGHHSAKHNRTQQSEFEVECLRERVLFRLETLARRDGSKLKSMV